MIYYYLNNDKLKAMFATAGGKRITVKEFYDMDFPSEFLKTRAQPISTFNLPKRCSI